MDDQDDLDVHRARVGDQVASGERRSQAGDQVDQGAQLEQLGDQVGWGGLRELADVRVGQDELPGQQACWAEAACPQREEREVCQALQVQLQVNLQACLQWAHLLVVRSMRLLPTWLVLGQIFCIS